MTWDIALVPDAQGKLVVHQAACPTARAAAEAGVPVATLYGCEKLPDDVELAACLKEPE